MAKPIIQKLIAGIRIIERSGNQGPFKMQQHLDAENCSLMWLHQFVGGSTGHWFSLKKIIQLTKSACLLPLLTTSVFMSDAAPLEAHMHNLSTLTKVDHYTTRGSMRLSVFKTVNYTYHWKYNTSNFFDIKFSTLCNPRWTIHQKLTSKTHPHAIKGLIANFDIRFLMYNLQGGTVMSNSMYCIFNITD